MNKDFRDKIAGKTFYSLKKILGDGSNLPPTLRVIIESVARNLDGSRVTEQDLENLKAWKANAERTNEIPFVVGRVLLQDLTGVPLGVDLATMRDVVAKQFGGDAKSIEPQVPVDLVIDHSVQVDVARDKDAISKNLEIEFARNEERYKFLKWCQSAFKSFKVTPPGFGICHQVNLEALSQGYLEKDGVIYFDSLVGTDSHTTMINGLGVVGWGVGGIEAEAGMLGEPISFLTPDVVAMRLTGTLKPGVTATDLVLTITEILRAQKVVGKFVEFIGPGASTLTVPDRATISNMAPEYGATIGFFGFDEESVKYLENTGRGEQAKLAAEYHKAQGLFGIPQGDEVEYTKTVELDLGSIEPSIAGPKRPQDRIRLVDVPVKVGEIIGGNISLAENRLCDHSPLNYALEDNLELINGDIVVAAITSCTNTSNPSVMLAAGLVAQKAIKLGLRVKNHIKTSLAPGSKVVMEYLGDLIEPLAELGFNLVGYGCTTCIGNSGPLHPDIEAQIKAKDLYCTSVLSGNRNFEARIHQQVKGNFLMSPPLVVAYALAGNILRDLNAGIGTVNGKVVTLKDIWPSPEEINSRLDAARNGDTYRKIYQNISVPEWDKIESPQGELFTFDDKSTYIRRPTFFEGMTKEVGTLSDLEGMKCLARFGDSITTDHISPAGGIKDDSPAALYLKKNGLEKKDFNTYGARRGNHEVMIRGTFANVRIKNQMVDEIGGYTVYAATKGKMDIFDAAEKYAETKTPLIVLAGKEYGTGSSRDWAAKGTLLLGVKVVIAQSFERIHRSNLIGMGVLPLQFKADESAESLGLTGFETFSIKGLKNLKPQSTIMVEIAGSDKVKSFEVLARIDTDQELQYLANGGIMQYCIRKKLS